MKRVARILSGILWLASSAPAAELAGIWMGPVTGRGGEKQDLAFQFKRQPDGTLAGVMFGDEFDLPVQELTISGDQVTFSVTSTNYYDGRRIKFLFAGRFDGKELTLTRERAGTTPGGDKQNPNQKVTLKRLTPSPRQ